MFSDRKTLVLFFGGAALFATVLVVSVNAILKSVPTPAPTPASALPPIGDEPAPASEEAPLFRIKKGAEDRRPIRYEGEGFTPSAVTIRNTDDLGCSISVQNRSSVTLIVGVSPHDPAGDPGANYGEIAPGETGVLDPRYAGLEQVTLHNHLHPAHEFTVVYGPGCW